MPSSLIKSFTSPWQEGLEKAEIAESIGRPAKFVQTWWRKEPKEVPKPAGEPRQHHVLVNFEEIWCLQEHSSIGLIDRFVVVFSRRFIAVPIYQIGARKLE